MDLLFDGSKPRFYKDKDLFASSSANCPTDGVPQLQAENRHLPWLVNKCFMEETERKYSDYFKSVRTATQTGFSPMCVYDSMMVGQGRASMTLDQSNHYGAVCHLGSHWSQCPIGRSSEGAPADLEAVTSLLNDPPVFFNLQ